MTAIFEMPLASETLSDEELIEITGARRASDQVDWLTANGWKFVKNRRGEPRVGRLFARLKLAGINPATVASQGGWTPDLTSLSL